MRKTLGTCVVVLVCVLITSPLLAQDRVGQLTKVSGTASITRAEDGRVEEARQVGPRVQNGSVFAGDVVTTPAAVTATLVFSDGTTLDLAEGTSLTVQEVDRSALVGSGGIDKPVGRKIRVLAGKIWADVIPNEKIATEFETPSGVAAVKGTKLVIEVQPEGAQ